jgi:hypothetical protein
MKCLILDVFCTVNDAPTDVDSWIVIRKSNSKLHLDRTIFRLIVTIQEIDIVIDKSERVLLSIRCMLFQFSILISHSYRIDILSVGKDLSARFNCLFKFDFLI